MDQNPKVYCIWSTNYGNLQWCNSHFTLEENTHIGMRMETFKIKKDFCYNKDEMVVLLLTAVLVNA